MVPISVDSSGNTVWSIERYAYDEAGNLVKKISFRNNRRTGCEEINYTYYANNLVRTVSDNSGAGDDQLIR